MSASKPNHKIRYCNVVLIRAGKPPEIIEAHGVVIKGNDIAEINSHRYNITTCLKSANKKTDDHAQWNVKSYSVIKEMGSTDHMR